jgi:Icc-related predicted phosphoesterase
MSTNLHRSMSAIIAITVVCLSWGGISRQEKSASLKNHVALELKVPAEFRFAAFGDTRFHDPLDTEAANPVVRRALIAAIDRERPAFVSLGGDIVYVGEDAKDWKVWDTETKIWQEHEITVYPAIGNHDLKGNTRIALLNYFARFPQLEGSRFYSVRVGNCLMLVLDSALDETRGPQGDWLREQLNSLPAGTDFVFLIMHHPPYTSSSDEKKYGGGHSARGTEQELAKILEEKQQHMQARIIVFSGHVHNYERHEHNGITYFVTGGGGAHAYPVPRAQDDLYRDPGINYHYLLVEVHGSRVEITMNKLEFKGDKEVWSKPDSVTIRTPATTPAAAHAP